MAHTSNPAKVRPMLAATTPVVASQINLDRGCVWVSPKYDGIRCLQMKLISTSRSLLPIANLHVQKVLSTPLLEGLDGELVVGSPTAPNCISTTTSGVNTASGAPEFCYYVFDCWDTPNTGFVQRKGYVRRRVATARRMGLPVALVPQVRCTTLAEVEQAIAENYANGFEGSIVRSEDDEYKYNRATLKEGYMLKVKESLDAEMYVLNFVEQMKNNNEAKVDERGLTKRSSHKANKVGAGTLGKIGGRDIATGRLLLIGTGKMTAKEKQEVWDNQEKYLGALAKYRYAPYGVKDLPRFGRFIAWRSPSDMS